MMGEKSWWRKWTQSSINLQKAMLIHASSDFHYVICHRTLLSTFSDGCGLISGRRMHLARCTFCLAMHQKPDESDCAWSVTSPGLSKAVLKCCRLCIVDHQSLARREFIFLKYLLSLLANSSTLRQLKTIYVKDTTTNAVCGLWNDPWRRI